jgi:hypothetical protein
VSCAGLIHLSKRIKKVCPLWYPLGPFTGQPHPRSLSHSFIIHIPYIVITFHFLACPTYGSLQCTVSLLPLAHYSNHLCFVTSIFRRSLLLTTLMMEVTHSYKTEVPIYQSMQICIKSMTGIISTGLREPQITCKVV